MSSYDPSTTFDRFLEDAFVSRFQPSFCSNLNQCQNPFRPRMDLFEAKEGNVVTVTLELPGLASGDVMIDVQEQRLTISGNTGLQARADDEGAYMVRERYLGKFFRVLQLPVGTKAEDVEAKMENGVLTVTFPRVAGQQGPHHIPIQ